MTGQWISDGSAEIIITGDASEVECQLASGTSGGNVYNGLWKESEQGATAGTHYWKIHVTGLNPNSIFVGLSDLEKFKKGWALKGLLFGGPGNLSNGSALIIGGYGPHIKSGNTVGILAVFEGEKLKVYFDLDGTPLGQAFDLPATVLNGVFPVVHFSGTGKASIVKSNDIPTKLNREEPVYEGIEGDWRCTEYKGQQPSTSVTVGIFKDKEQVGEQVVFNASLHVINRIHYGLHQDAKSGNWKTTGGMSTLMGGPPELMQLERQMSSLVGNPSRLDVEDGHVLVISNACGDTSKWERYSTAKSAVTENPFY